MSSYWTFILQKLPQKSRDKTPRNDGKIRNVAPFREAFFPLFLPAEMINENWADVADEAGHSVAFRRKNIPKNRKFWIFKTFLS